jgi:hypothetical protein
MSLQTWQETLITSQVDSTALANSTTATSILPPAAVFTLPPNYMVIGKQLRIIASGRISNIITSPGTLTIAVRFGGSIVVFSGGAMSLNTTAKTNVGWWFDAMLTCRSIGSGTTATILGQAQFTSESVVSSAAGLANTLMLPASAPTVGSGFDSTTTQTVDLYGTWSVANAGNSVLTHQYALISAN